MTIHRTKVWSHTSFSLQAQLAALKDTTKWMGRRRLASSRGPGVTPEEDEPVRSEGAAVGQQWGSSGVEGEARRPQEDNSWLSESPPAGRGLRGQVGWSRARDSTTTTQKVWGMEEAGRPRADSAVHPHFPSHPAAGRECLFLAGHSCEFSVISEVDLQSGTMSLVGDVKKCGGTRMKSDEHGPLVSGFGIMCRDVTSPLRCFLCIYSLCTSHQL